MDLKQIVQVRRYERRKTIENDLIKVIN